METKDGDTGWVLVLKGDVYVSISPAEFGHGNPGYLAYIHTGIRSWPQVLGSGSTPRLAYTNAKTTLQNHIKTLEGLLKGMP